MLSLNELREVFAKSLLENYSNKFSMDVALLEVAKVAYQQGIIDGQYNNKEK